MEIEIIAALIGALVGSLGGFFGALTLRRIDEAAEKQKTYKNLLKKLDAFKRELRHNRDFYDEFFAKNLGARFALEYSKDVIQVYLDKLGFESGYKQYLLNSIEQLRTRNQKALKIMVDFYDDVSNKEGFLTSFGDACLAFQSHVEGWERVWNIVRDSPVTNVQITFEEREIPTLIPELHPELEFPDTYQEIRYANKFFPEELESALDDQITEFEKRVGRKKRKNDV